MRFAFFAAAFILAASTVSADDATGPVRTVMDITVRNWGNADSEWSYVFAPEPLERLFSLRFRSAYLQASKRPAYETEDGGPGDPFGYDVVTASQDGCPLEDLAIEPGAEQTGMTPVKVTFKLWRCLDQAELRESLNEVHFDVVMEGGRFVIDDIHRVGPDGRDSVLVEMEQLAAEPQ